MHQEDTPALGALNYSGALLSISLFSTQKDVHFMKQYFARRQEKVTEVMSLTCLGLKTPDMQREHICTYSFHIIISPLLEISNSNKLKESKERHKF